MIALQTLEHRMRWRGQHSAALKDTTTYETAIEGAIRAGKTTVCLWREFNAVLANPGIHTMIARWTDDGLFGLVAPLWRRICQDANVPLNWHSDEKYDELPNGSRVYLRGLKSQDQTLRYCCDPDTLVLHADLAWRRMGDYNEGDVLVGCDEYAPGGHRRLRRSTVLARRVFEDDKYRVVTTRGEIVVNADHPFLTSSRSRPGKAKTGANWTPLRSLQVGDVIKYLVDPWVDKSDSWFSGILDGEGYVSLSDRAVVAVAQREGVVLDRMRAVCEREGFQPKQYAPHESTGHDCQSLVFCRISDVLRVLGTYRPVRFLDKAIRALLAGDSALPHKNDHAVILAIEPVGRGLVVGLETSTKTLMTNGFVSHNSKFRGLTLARVYIDQAEEIPEDVYLEVTGRLSQQGFPYQMTISPQSVEQGHWIAQRFPEDNRYVPKRKLVQLSVNDNAHNLTSEYLANLWSVYPPGHPKHKTLILGQRGMNVTGEPVYKGAFVRTLHERVVPFNKELPLDVGLDFGKHHPCVVFRQTTPLGAVHYLGGILGQQMYLEDFLPVVLRYKADWFPNPCEERWCIDPAGASDNSQGTRVNGTTILERHHIHAVYVPNSNAPDVRHEMIERHAALMRKRTATGEAFAINKDQFIRVSEGNAVTDQFLADGFEAGYVWDEHFVSVGSKQMRKAKKDGWYEHGQNASEYLELNFGGRPWKKPLPAARVFPRVSQNRDTAWLA